MKALGCSIIWHDQYSNDPEIRINVDMIPEFESLRFKQDDIFYLAQSAGYVRYFAYEKPGRGFGGHSFELTMEDGTKKTLEGPWSSNSKTISQVFGVEAVEVILCEPDGSGLAASVTLDFVRDALKLAKENRPVIFEIGKHGYWSVRKQKKPELKET